METTLTKLNMKESLQKGEIVNDSQKIISNLTKENESLKKYNGILKDTIRNLKLEMDNDTAPVMEAFPPSEIQNLLSELFRLNLCRNDDFNLAHVGAVKMLKQQSG